MARPSVFILLLEVLHIIPPIEANDHESRPVSHGVDSWRFVACTESPGGEEPVG
jgi:hypothetical protein